MTDQTQMTAPPMDFRKARFSVQTASGQRYEGIKLMPGDIVAAERQYDIRASDLESGAKLEHILYMVWVAARRGEYRGDFEAFLGEVDDLDITSGQGGANPTLPAQ